MKVGIAITTYKRPDHIAHCLSQIHKYTSPDVLVHVEDDSTDRKGVFYRKNKCLKVLLDAGCDYFFLLDDDIFPITNGWIEYYVESSQATQQELLLYNPYRALSIRNGLKVVLQATGCLFFLTRKAVTTLGGFNTTLYQMYGYGHETYISRAHQAGLTSYGLYLSPSRASTYLYALDLDRHLPVNLQLRHCSSLTTPDKMRFLSHNKKVKTQDTKVYHHLE